MISSKNKGPEIYWKLNDRQLCDLELILNGGFFSTKKGSK